MSMINTTTALIDSLVENNRFASKKLTADHIGADNFNTWKSLVSALQNEAYHIYCKCENDNLAEETKHLNLDGVFNAIRDIFNEFGEINGHKIKPTAEFATLIIGYSGKRANSDAPELQLCASRIKNRQAELKLLKATNGVNPDAIAHVEAEIEALNAEKAVLLATPDMRTKAPTRAAADTFRLEVEHRFARLISDQKAKTWEELEAEKEAARQARRAKTAEKKAAKKAESK